MPSQYAFKQENMKQMCETFRIFLYPWYREGFSKQNTENNDHIKNSKIHCYKIEKEMHSLKERYLSKMKRQTTN